MLHVACCTSHVARCGVAPHHVACRPNEDEEWLEPATAPSRGLTPPSGAQHVVAGPDRPARRMPRRAADRRCVHEQAQQRKRVVDDSHHGDRRRRAVARHSRLEPEGRPGPRLADCGLARHITAHRSAHEKPIRSTAGWARVAGPTAVLSTLSTLTTQSSTRCVPVEYPIEYHRLEVSRAGLTRTGRSTWWSSNPPPCAHRGRRD